MEREVVFQCEVCSRRFDTERGLATHLGRTHRGAGVSRETICCVCGSIFRVSRSQERRGKGLYCSRRCRGSVQRTRQEVACSICGKLVVRAPAQLARHSAVGCSQKCKSEILRRKYTQPKVNLKCEQCGKSFVLSWGKQQSGRWCSYECSMLARRKRETVPCEVCGLPVERHPCEPARKYCSRRCFGIGRQVDVARQQTVWMRATNGGRKWKEDCRRRDEYRCGLCGKQYGSRSTSLHVHHKAPFALYSELRSVLGNGISLCARCSDGRGHYWVHSSDGQSILEAWRREALAEFGHLLEAEREVA